MRPHFAYALLSCLLFAASGIIRINSNDFADLSTKQRSNFRPFSIVDAGRKLSYADSCVLQTINHHNLSELSRQYPVLWVRYFAPWCSRETCEDVGTYQRKAASCGPNVRLVLVSL